MRRGEVKQKREVKRMVKYCIKRLLLALLILAGVSLIIWTLVWCMPISYIDKQASILAGNTGNVEEIKAQLKVQLGMDGTMLEGYWKWLTKFLRGDFGKSFSAGSPPVSKIIFENMGVSFALSFVALILELIIAIPLGIKCACNQYGKLDYTATVFTMIGISFPTFFFAPMCLFDSMINIPFVGYLLSAVLDCMAYMIFLALYRKKKYNYWMKNKV